MSKTSQSCSRVSPRGDGARPGTSQALLAARPHRWYRLPLTKSCRPPPLSPIPSSHPAFKLLPNGVPSGFTIFLPSDAGVNGLLDDIPVP